MSYGNSPRLCMKIIAGRAMNFYRAFFGRKVDRVVQ